VSAPGAGGAPPRAARRIPAVAWVAVVLAVGLAAGTLVALAVPSLLGPPPPGAGPTGPFALGRASGVLSILNATLIAALLFVYARTYVETRARFALGLVVFLAALFVQTLASSPAIFGAFGVRPGALGPFLFLGTLFEAIALAVFLALSLE